MLNSRSKSNPALSSSSDWIANRHLKSANGRWSHLKPGGVVKHCGWCDVGTVLGERRWGLGMVKRSMGSDECSQACSFPANSFLFVWYMGSAHLERIRKGFMACDPWHPLDLWPQVFQHAVQLAWRQLPHCHSFGLVAFHPQAVNGGVVCCDAFQSLEYITVCLCRLCTPLHHMHTHCACHKLEMYTYVHVFHMYVTSHDCIMTRKQTMVKCLPGTIYNIPLFCTSLLNYCQNMHVHDLYAAMGQLPSLLLNTRSAARQSFNGVLENYPSEQQRFRLVKVTVRLGEWGLWSNLVASQLWTFSRIFFSSYKPFRVWEFQNPPGFQTTNWSGGR